MALFIERPNPNYDLKETNRCYSIYSIENLKHIEDVTHPETLPLGQGWSLRVSVNPAMEVTGINIFDNKGKLFSTWAKGTVTSRPSYARISRDSKSLLLAFERAGTSDTKEGTVFYIYNIQTGEQKWYATVYSKLMGMPLLQTQELWYIQPANDLKDLPEKKDKNVYLFRRSHLNKDRKRKSEIVLTLKLEDKHNIVNYAPIS